MKRQFTHKTVIDVSDMDGAAMLPKPEGITTHSPGPWAVARSKRDNAALLVFNRTGKWALASCSWPAGVRMEECEANAYLMSAAPELLEACKQIVACSKYWGNAFSGERMALKLAQAAIFKATNPTSESATYFEPSQDTPTTLP
jgi:hypothetical protein